MNNYELFSASVGQKRKRPIRLRTARDARKLVAALINQVYRREMDPARAARLGYLAGILLKSIETADIEQRLVELEKKLSEKE
jgi:hypothetical protein